ncbi:PAS domain S-box protein [Nocardioides sp. YIM 152315]|uniref:PAS domain S-box protein n=1 Tax=Nocardioides sp. YIM 152315 TaxID=3031760 RepID=UPI0023DAB2A4|nr:PAS domain S-box protein [Nocardioides sp. YIM 152315]MDF1602923.1 PAS domain S-box protein [Nocardioides sp. YIM 152315]
MGWDGSRPTIVVVDDAAEVRVLVRARLRLSGLLDVVGEAGDGAEAVDLVRRLQPALVLLDVSMPVMDGLEALPHVLAAAPATTVVMYSGFQEEGLAHRALELGAAAFLEKSTSLDSLPGELLDVLTGHVEPAAEPTSPPLPTEVDDAEGRVLRDHLERFREVFEDAAIGMATVTLSGRVVRANGSLSAILERSREDLVGTPYAEFAGDAAGDLERLLEGILDGSVESGRIEHGVAGIVRPRRVVATVAPVLDGSGRPLYLFVQVQDVTRQRGAEEELRRSEFRFRLLVDNVEDYAIFMLSPAGVVESWNAGAQRINGYSEHEIVGRHFRAFYPPALQQARHPEHELELARRDGRYEEEGWRIRKDGTQFWATVVITAVRDSGGRHVGFAKVVRDITERRRMLEEREEAADALAAANARLQQSADDQAHSLAVTVHELRTPVSVLGGTAEVLEDHWAELGDFERSELLAGMSSSATRLRRLFDDLLTASRLQRNRLELQLEQLDVAPVVAASVATARRRFPEIAIGVDADPGLMVVGDAGRLGQAIDNLVANAVTHGEPPVDVAARAAGDDVLVTVQDAGVGVPAEMRERLFDRFATGRAAGGTGLGLYIVRELAREHGGDAWYRPPEGSAPGAFTVRLPRAGAGRATTSGEHSGEVLPRFGPSA